MNATFNQQKPQVGQMDKLIPSPLPAANPSTVCTMVHGVSEGVPSPVIQPVLRPVPGYLLAVPYQNVGMIPVGDNFSGLINTSVLPSLDPNGQDLPLHGQWTCLYLSESLKSLR